MMSRRLNYQQTPSESKDVAQFTDANGTQCEPRVPQVGIRPTRKGPWDPCRFQEYELSPEFRRQIMLAKPTPADPRIFEDTSPPAAVTLFSSPRLANKNRGAGTIETVQAVRHVQSSNTPIGRRLAILVVGGVLLGLAAGYGASRFGARAMNTNRTSVNVTGLAGSN